MPSVPRFRAPREVLTALDWVPSEHHGGVLVHATDGAQVTTVDVARGAARWTWRPGVAPRSIVADVDGTAIAVSSGTQTQVATVDFLGRIHPWSAVVVDHSGARLVAVTAVHSPMGGDLQVLRLLLDDGAGCVTREVTRSGVLPSGADGPGWRGAVGVDGGFAGIDAVGRVTIPGVPRGLADAGGDHVAVDGGRGRRGLALAVEQSDGGARQITLDHDGTLVEGLQLPAGWREVRVLRGAAEPTTLARTSSDLVVVPTVALEDLRPPEPVAAAPADHYDVFISYKHRDEGGPPEGDEIAQQFYGLLTGPVASQRVGRPLRVFLDVNDGIINEWKPWITHAVKHSSVMLVICTPGTITTWEKYEAGADLDVAYNQAVEVDQWLKQTDQREFTLPVIRHDVAQSALPAALGQYQFKPASDVRGITEVVCAWLAAKRPTSAPAS